MTAAEQLASPDWQAFLARIREAPDDDTPRLVAADWLEDRGLDRAAWQLRGRCPQTAGQGLRWRVPGTWAGTPYDGLPPMPELATFTSNYIIHRGMVDAVECTATEWLASGPAVVRHPLACMTAVRLTDRHPGESTAFASARGGRYSGTRYYWFRQDNPAYLRPTAGQSDQHLPPDVFKILRGRLYDGRWKHYPSAAAAHAALSAACLRYAWWAADPGPPREM